MTKPDVLSVLSFHSRRLSSTRSFRTLSEAESDSHESVCSSSEKLISVRYRAHCGLRRQLRNVRSMVFNCYNLHTILYCLLLVRINLVHYTNDMRGQKVFCPSFMIIHEFIKNLLCQTSMTQQVLLFLIFNFSICITNISINACAAIIYTNILHAALICELSLSNCQWVLLLMILFGSFIVKPSSS